MRRQWEQPLRSYNTNDENWEKNILETAAIGIEKEKVEKERVDMKDEAARNGPNHMAVGDIRAEDIAQAEFSPKLRIITA